jgi:superfamily II DNA or RNA helicase
MLNDGLENVLNLYFGDVAYRATDAEAKEAIVPGNKVFVVIQDAPVHYSAPIEYKARQKNISVTYDGKILDIIFWMGKGFVINSISINGKRMPLDAVNRELFNSLIDSGIIQAKTMNYHLAKQAVANNEPFREMLISDVIKEAENGKSSIVFCSEKEHIELLSAAFSSAGYDDLTQCYYGNSTDKKEVIKQRAETREKLITLATYAIATEGTNIKAFERVFMAMPIANEKDLMQAIGRARRLLKGKTEVIVYDYRFPHVSGMEGQGWKRDVVYRKHKFVIKGAGNGIRRGFKK